MTRGTRVPVAKPTETERKIWEQIQPRKIGGIIRQGSTKFRDQMIPCDFGPADKANPEHWDDKMLGGPRAEWWAYMMEGAHRILDIGCGFGFPSFYLASCGFEVVGVDASPSQIAAAEWYRQEGGPSYRLEFQVTEQTELPFEDNSFDGATFSSSLECVGDPDALIQEVIRVLKPGSPLAVDQEERRFEQKTHPVWENQRITVIDDVSYLWVDTRVCDPYLDRRYMIRLAEDGKLTGHFRREAPADVFRWDVALEETGLSLEEVLSEAVDGEYGEARGYDTDTLREFLEKMGFTDPKCWLHNDGGTFAKALQGAGVLADMPDDIRAVSRALVESIGALNISAGTGLVSCRSPR